MTTEKVECLVLTDQEGNYYAITREMLDRARVPEERKAELQQYLGNEDVSSFAPFWLRPAGFLQLPTTFDVGGAGFGGGLSQDLLTQTSFQINASQGFSEG